VERSSQRILTTHSGSLLRTPALVNMLVAQTIGDPTRALAGTDCGFDTAAGPGEVVR
jgi:methionine synthase II (cobalamin-independent)